MSNLTPLRTPPLADIHKMPHRTNKDCDYDGCHLEISSRLYVSSIEVQSQFSWTSIKCVLTLKRTSMVWTSVITLSPNWLAPVSQTLMKLISSLTVEMPRVRQFHSRADSNHSTLCYSRVNHLMWRIKPFKALLVKYLSPFLPRFLHFLPKPKKYEKNGGKKTTTTIRALEENAKVTLESACVCVSPASLQAC